MSETKPGAASDHAKTLRQRAYHWCGKQADVDACLAGADAIERLAALEAALEWVFSQDGHIRAYERDGVNLLFWDTAEMQTKRAEAPTASQALLDAHRAAGGGQ